MRQFRGPVQAEQCPGFYGDFIPPIFPNISKYFQVTGVLFNCKLLTDETPVPPVVTTVAPVETTPGKKI